MSLGNWLRAVTQIITNSERKIIQQKVLLGSTRKAGETHPQNCISAGTNLHHINARQC